MGMGIGVGDGFRAGCVLLRMIRYIVGQYTRTGDCLIFAKRIAIA